MTQIAKEEIAEQKLKENTRLNKNKIEKNIKVGDFAFILNRSVVPGAARVLKTKLHESPWVVIRTLFTSSLLKRIVDGRVALYANSDIKIYNPKSPQIGRAHV